MLGIFGKKSDHPLADIKSVQELLQNLPKNDAHKTLMELTEWIESVTANTEFKLDHQFAVLRMLDEAAQPHARKLTREYFTPFEINKFQENRLWMVLNSYYQQLAKSYLEAFNRFCYAEKGSNNIKPHVPLLTARAVYAITCQMKFICSRYGQISSSIWTNLAQLYKHAEQLQYLDTPVRLYAAQTANTSVKCQIGGLLVWYDSGLSHLSPLYIHITELIVSQFCSSIDLHTEISQHSRLGFDLTRPLARPRIPACASSACKPCRQRWKT